MDITTAFWIFILCLLFLSVAGLLVTYLVSEWAFERIRKRQRKSEEDLMDYIEN